MLWGAHVFVAAFALVALYTGHGPPLARVGLFAAVVFSTVCVSTAGHTASHRGMSERGFVNELVLHLSYPLLLGLSARYWMWSHVRVHHPAPNHVGIDRDCDLRPMFALNEEHVAERSPLGRRWAAAQGFLLPILLPLNGFGIQIQGVRALGRELSTSDRCGRSFLDAALLLAHVGLFVALPCLVLSPATVLTVYALRTSIVGIALFAILAPGHYPADAACVDRGATSLDFARRQVVTTIDFRTGAVGRMLCNGLEYQIEHHLFPTIHHRHLPEVARRVEAFCGRVGLPYRTLSWSRAIWESYLVFFRPKPVIDLRAPRSVSTTPPSPAETSVVDGLPHTEGA